MFDPGLRLQYCRYGYLTQKVCSSQSRLGSVRGSKGAKCDFQVGKRPKTCFSDIWQASDAKYPGLTWWDHSYGQLEQIVSESTLGFWPRSMSKGPRRGIFLPFFGSKVHSVPHIMSSRGSHVLFDGSK